jgi:hypothetical protein
MSEADPPVIQALRNLHRAPACKCVVGRCRRNDSECALDLRGRITLCLDCDRCAAFRVDRDGQRLPDFVILVAEDDTIPLAWCVVEMKRGATDPGNIRTQLQAGADIVRTAAEFRLDPPPTVLLPLFLHSAEGFRTADQAKLQAPGNGVIYRGVALPIVAKRSHTRGPERLADILAE